jgi:hypothetical protein
METSVGRWHIKLIWKTWPQTSFIQKQPKEITKNMYNQVSIEKNLEMFYSIMI